MDFPNQNYRVFFKQKLSDHLPKTSLNFQAMVDTPIILKNFAEFQRKFNELARKKQVFQMINIKEVKTFGGVSLKKITKYFVLLITKKLNEKVQRMGFLIGNHEELGFCLLGVWPIQVLEKSSIQANWDVFLDKVLHDEQNYADTILIT
jgi:hypothetical protein